jgi:phosphate transport system protein
MLGSRHTHSTYESELYELSVHMTRMAVRAHQMVVDAVRSLLDRDAELARRVIAVDRELDRLELDADERCLRLLARRAPFGEDLRLVTVSLKLVTDLERIGDLAVNIAQRGLELMQSTGVGPGADVELLAAAAIGVLERAVRAWQTRDAAVAAEVMRGDLDVDALNRRAFATFIRLARERPDQFDRTLALTSVCRYLERVADHAVNMAELTVFLITADDVRHRART